MPAPKPLIMIVEDESLLREAIKAKLEKRGCETISCGSGPQGLEYLQTLERLPDLIWLDYYLTPAMNGLEFIEEIKKDSRLSSIPIVVVSNSSSDARVKQMLALGVAGYILKAERRLDEIVDEIKKIIKR